MDRRMDGGHLTSLRLHLLHWHIGKMKTVSMLQSDYQTLLSNPLQSLMCYFASPVKPFSLFFLSSLCSHCLLSSLLDSCSYVVFRFFAFPCLSCCILSLSSPLCSLPLQVTLLCPFLASWLSLWLPPASSHLVLLLFPDCFCPHEISTNLISCLAFAPGTWF